MELDFYKTFSINIDLAIEAHDLVRGQTGQEIPGVVVDREKYENSSVTIVKIVEEQAEQLMGKPRGNYITIEAPSLRENNRLAQQEIAEVLAKKLSSLFNLPEKANILLVGLGNWNATPDALGPKVIEHSMVTRHLFKYAPEELGEGMRSVSAIAPGVLGITGIETAEIIKGIVEKIKPELVIVIDSLAAGSVDRIAATIQIADTGINPGSGIGNHRTGINQASMGVPVIAIGIPTVVHAAVIAQVTVEHFLEQLKENPVLNQIYQNLRPDFTHQVIDQVLQPFAGNLMVTPKEIDSLILNTSKTVAGGISMALHPSINFEDFNIYLN
ncbi:GPR endopeptidase [Pelotomaculum sp. PtaB.Bin117]|uniref:GPR endopeptidase n=1 Tax=Pelotomaculum sp. PtaB.Bin117 TaxID=1811694 RepID=UPI0009D2A3DD|nr:GPR endopeptidase [Pelotomaculum sp. PtaB.Bin117]OPX86040.1 MAG: Germination protease precursor [Pelotomaculum sp. PtaB.Bin117]OPY61190.1 MAG: Germination protease precursor [Pelotomaculum sp. PtaU1.Bin065]